MLALARLQRKFRLLESPYRTPQTLVGGPRLDAALAGLVRPHGDHQGDGQGLDAVPAPGPDRGAARSSSRSGSRSGATHYGSTGPLRVELRPHRAGSELLELAIVGNGEDEGGQRRLRADPGPPRPQHPLGARPEHLRRALRKKRLMTLIHLFLIHRYKADSVHYVTPDRGQPVPDGEDEGARASSRRSTPRSARSSSPTSTAARIAELLAPDRAALGKLIRKER